ncbi:hypothetical protein CYMTET_26235 [Cymbomonas tetramitiformis]|uniref:Tetratricopeptide repeat protein n=1 Tax=Cymbomonas tetramitiformis TaxID=36881 RepID=A0AAE0FS57_9CHLO|nr:hypothetical protein CYMTET_26235 [Cymbomonas tetramitiformis]
MIDANSGDSLPVAGSAYLETLQSAPKASDPEDMVQRELDRYFREDEEEHVAVPLSDEKKSPDPHTSQDHQYEPHQKEYLDLDEVVIPGLSVHAGRDMSHFDSHERDLYGSSSYNSPNNPGYDPGSSTLSDLVMPPPPPPDDLAHDLSVEGLSEYQLEHPEAHNSVHSTVTRYHPEPALAVLFERYGGVDAALDLLQRSAEHNPKDPVLWSDLGNAHRVKGNTDRAIECFESALRLQPHPDFFLNLGGVRFVMGELDEAVCAAPSSSLSPHFSMTDPRVLGKSLFQLEWQR